MACFETWFKNDLTKPINVVQLRGVMFNLDNFANLIGVELEYNGQPAALEGTIAGYVIKNDGTTLNLTTTTGKAGNKAWVILPQEAYTVEGPISIVIKHVYNSAETTIGACAGYVTRSRTSSEIAPTGTVIPSLASLEAAIAAANAAAVNAADAVDYIAPTEDDSTASAAHAVGSYFIYNGNLMKATSAIAQGATIVPYASGVTNYNCAEVPNGLSGDVYNVTNVANAAANNAADAQQLVAPVESMAGMPTGAATMAHATGSYFVFGGVLYKATSDIAIGDPIVTTGTGANAAQVPGGVTGEVADLKSAIDEITDVVTGFFTNENEGGLFTVTPNSYTKGGSPSTLSNYYLYQLTASKDFTFNCNGTVTNSAHLYICIFTGSTISSAYCRAKYANDGSSGLSPLPTTDVTVQSGETLTISYYSTSNSPSYFKIPTNYIQTVTLNDDLPLTAEMRENVEELIGGNSHKKYLQYNTDGFLMVYVPSKDKYIGYIFIHTVNAQKHTDVWRIDKASLYDETLTFVKDLTTDGEWECAVGLYGRPTGSSHFGSGFIGGKQHGNETLNSIIWFVDNEIVDITEYTQLTEWETLNIVESTNMYDSNDDETVCCIHGSNHIFSEDGLVIRQSLDWKIATQMRATYMAMYPAKKEVANTLITNKNWAAIAVDGSQLIQNEVTYAMIYKESENIRAEFAVTDYPHVDVDGNYFMLTDNTVDHSGAYNKCYYAVTANNGTASVAIGDLWVSTTLYNIRVM